MRRLTTVLVLVQVAALVTGSVPSARSSGSGQRFIDSLDIKNVDTSTMDRLTRDAESATVEDGVKKAFGFSKEDLTRLDAGYMIVPRSTDLDTLTPQELISKVAQQKTEVVAERQRAQQAVQTSIEAVAQQQYLDGVHDSLQDSYDEAVERSKERVKEQIKQIQGYFQKFPSVVTACT